MLEKVYKQLQRWLPDEPCLLCHQPTEHKIALCDQCHPKLPRLQHPPLELVSSGRWNRVHIPFFYREPLSPLIQQLKFSHTLHHARQLGLLFGQSLQQSSVQKPELIIPIPLHGRRLRERGFNQAIEIIQGPARALKIPIDRTHFRRTRATHTQTGLNAKARKQNLQRAFEMKRPLDGLHIALFDDVVTTGSTAVAATQVLKQAGAAKIDLWALAYTPPEQ